MESLRNNQTISIKKLINTFQSLDSLEKLQLQTSEIISIKNSMKDIIEPNNPEYNLEYTWDNEKVKSSIMVDGETINFAVWTARVEHSKRKKYNSINGNEVLRPKKERTEVDTIPVVFYEKKHEVYICIATKNDYLLERVKKLIDNKNISFDLVNSLAKDNRFIEWLFWRYMENERNLNENISLDLITSFEGTIINGDVSDLFKGRSLQIPELNITKSILALDEALNACKLQLSWDNSALEFLYSKNGMTAINVNSTFIQNDILLKDSTDTESYKKLVFIVGFVVPKLIELFREDSEKFSNKYNEFRQDQALSVIRKLINLNDIDKEDI